jgi:cyclic pyranopterin phosphate synthase
MRRVFILSSHPLLGRGIETLLCQETELQIVGHERDLDRAIEQIKTLQPDVVIVDANDSEDNRARVLMRVLNEGCDRVCWAELRDNTVSIYQGEQRVIEELRDFVEAIKSEVHQPVSTWGQGRQAQDTTTIDRFGRTLNYLRVSVTDRCNLRCVYCMPPEGVRPKPREAILHSEEIARIVEAAAGIGFRTIRLTGGEPLVRRGVVGLVKRLAAIPGVDEVALTTNAILLSSYARDLATAGLKRVNISLDSLRPERFRRITRLGDLKSVWQGIEAAEAAGLVPLKINVVVIRGFNDDEVTDLARLTLDHAWHIRFIEVMPLASVSEWGSDMPPAGERLVTTREVRHRLEELGPLEPTSGPCGHGRRAITGYQVPRNWGSSVRASISALHAIGWPTWPMAGCAPVCR